MITERQKQALGLVMRGKTLREIGAAMGITSSNGANDHLHRLEFKGMIRRRRGMGKRTPWEITDAGLAALGLRRCEHCAGDGTVAAR